MTTFEHIRLIVCNGEGIPVDMLMDCKDNRSRELVHARQLIMYFMREFTNWPLRMIGDLFGKDHATALYSIEVIQGFVDSDKKIADKVEMYRIKIKAAIQYDFVTVVSKIENLCDLIENCMQNQVAIDPILVDAYNKLLMK